ncbi:MAG: hypothetical protein PHQ28_00220 [Mycobacterium sp.]|nr:hypothetical protein [Mycobacterium sp.]
MAVVFLDTETTGTHRGYRAWEVAMIRRDDDGAEQSITIFVDQADLDLAHADPAALAIGRFEQRHPGFGFPLQPGQVHLREAQAARIVHQWTAQATVWGVNPSYDTIGLDGMLARQGIRPSWFYVPQDICGIAFGFKLGSYPPPPRAATPLSLACGVSPPGPQERHTAMGDADWVRRWFDKLAEYGPVGAS